MRIVAIVFQTVVTCPVAGMGFTKFFCFRNYFIPTVESFLHKSGSAGKGPKARTFPWPDLPSSFFGALEALPQLDECDQCHQRVEVAYIECEGVCYTGQLALRYPAGPVFGYICRKTCQQIRKAGHFKCNLLFCGGYSWPPPE